MTRKEGKEAWLSDTSIEECGASPAESTAHRRCRRRGSELELVAGSRLAPLPSHCRGLLRTVRRRTCSSRNLPPRQQFHHNSSVPTSKHPLFRNIKQIVTRLTGVAGGDDACALEVAGRGAVTVGLVVGVHRERGMRLQVVRVEAYAAALYRLAVHIAAGVVDVILQVRPVGASLGDAPLPAS